jgi:hypothetical protein
MTKPTTKTPTKRPARTVKINDDLHYRIRVQAVMNRIPMQTLIEQLLESGLTVAAVTSGWRGGAQ